MKLQDTVHLREATRMPEIQLITRGDDAGCNYTANVAILDAYRNGILRNTSVMVPAPAFAEAARLLKTEPGLCVGLHATLTAEWDNLRWGPVIPPQDVPSLVDRNGLFFQTTRALRDHRPSLEEIMLELDAQLAVAREAGLDIRYADTHMGFEHVLPGLADEFARWCRLEGLLDAHNFDNRLPDVNCPGDPIERFLRSLEVAPPGQYVVVGHPAYDTAEMRALGHKGYPGEEVASERNWQRLMFMDPRVLTYCQENGVELLRYDQARRTR